MSNPPRAYWGFLFISLAAIGFGVAFVVRHLLAPSDGARLEPGENALSSDGVIVTPLEAQMDGLRAGDLVVAVEGRSLENWTRTLFGDAPRLSPAFGQTLTYVVVRDGEVLEAPVTLGRYPLAANLHRNWGLITFALAYLLLAGFIFVRRPNNPAARILFLAAGALISSTAWSFGLTIGDFTDGIGFWLFKICTLLFYNLFWTAGLHFAMLFPRPLPPLKRRGVVPALYGVPYLLLLGYLVATRPISSGVLDWFSRWTFAEGVHAAVFLSATLVAVFIQYRRNRSGAPRQQMRWLAWAGLLSGGGGLLFYILPGALGLGAVDPNLLALIVLPYPIVIAVAILRHNLFDIEFVLNRTLVYGALTVSTMGLYIFSVGFLGTFFQTRAQPLLAFLTTGLVAVFFQPLREWLQRRVNRWMYGERDDPVIVLRKLGERLEGTGTPQATLAGIVETVAQALKLPFVAIEWGEEGEAIASFGVPSAQAERLPMAYQGEPMGHLVIGHRSRKESFSPNDRQLLENIARQAAAIVYSAQLTADLLRARERLVTSREEERRRIRRDLHDELGPDLAGLALKLDAARNTLGRDPHQADQLLAELKAQAQASVHKVRRLAYNLRPPALDEMGLAEALRERAEALSSAGRLHIRVSCPDHLPPLSAAIEVAAYRIAQEAMTNAMRHSGGTRCDVRLRIGRGLELEVIDDGSGVDPQGRKGVGLLSMRERAAELGGTFEIGAAPGGGARLFVRFPLPGKP